MRFLLVNLFFIIAVYSIKENDFPRKFTLNTNFDIPAVGLGTGTIREYELMKRVVDEALSLGYRLFDSAQVYKNEKLLGKAFKELLPSHNLTRSDIFITTKLVLASKYETVADYENLAKVSLTNFESDYIDLFLIHEPGVEGIPNNSEEVLVNRHLAWKALTNLQKEGLIRSIGVSNFAVKHLQTLKNNSEVIPAVNQVEWNVRCHDYELLKYCKDNNIQLQGFSTLGTPFSTVLRTDSRVTQIAENLNKSPVQVLLRWANQNGVAIIPKTTSKKHLEENLNLDFVIPEEEMKILDSFEQERFDIDPNEII